MLQWSNVPIFSLRDNEAIHKSNEKNNQRNFLHQNFVHEYSDVKMEIEYVNKAFGTASIRVKNIPFETKSIRSRNFLKHLQEIGIIFFV